MALKKLQARLTGTAELLMHNGQTADPLNDYSKRMKEISSKRVKTDQDYEDMARIEFMAGLYLDEKHHPCIPGMILEAAICGRGGAAGKAKARKQATAGIFVEGTFPLEYDGPTDPEEMFENDSTKHVGPVRVQTSKVIRTRPMIPMPWAADVEITYNDRLVNERQVADWLVTAGEEVGLMDWRPRYGRFTVEVLNGKT